MFKGAGLFVARAWSQIASTLLFIAAARLLSQNDVGVFAIASALTMVLTQWVGVGAYEYVIRERSDPDAEHTAFWLNLCVAVVLALAGAGIAAGSDGWFDAPGLSLVILALAPLTVPAGCRSAVEAVMVRDGKLARLAIAGATVEAISLAAGVLALMQGWGLWALVVHKWTQTVGAALALAISAGWLPKARFRLEIVRRMVRFGSGIFGDRFLSYFQSYGVDLFLGVVLTPGAVAIFRVAARLVTACVTIITEPLRQISWKLLADAAHEGGSVARAAEKTIGLTIGLMTGPMLGLVLTADLVVRLVLGDRWDASAPVVQVLALAALISTPQLLTEAALGVSSRTRWLPVVRIGAIATLFALLVLFGRNGPLGAASGQLAAAVALSIAAVLIQLKLIGIRMTNYLGDLAVYLTAGGLMAGAVLAARWGMERLQWSDLVALTVSVATGGLCYLAAVALMRRRQISDALMEIRSTRGMA